MLVGAKHILAIGLLCIIAPSSPRANVVLIYTGQSLHRLRRHLLWVGWWEALLTVSCV